MALLSHIRRLSTTCGGAVAKAGLMLSAPSDKAPKLGALVLSRPPELKAAAGEELKEVMPFAWQMSIYSNEPIASKQVRFKASEHPPAQQAASSIPAPGFAATASRLLLPDELSRQSSNPIFSCDRVRFANNLHARSHGPHCAAVAAA